jgi:hypothetical protein
MRLAHMPSYTLSLLCCLRICRQIFQVVVLLNKRLSSLRLRVLFIDCLRCLHPDYRAAVNLFTLLQFSASSKSNVHRGDQTHALELIALSVLIALVNVHTHRSGVSCN